MIVRIAMVRIATVRIADGRRGDDEMVLVSGSFAGCKSLLYFFIVLLFIVVLSLSLFLHFESILSSAIKKKQKTRIHYLSLSTKSANWSSRRDALCAELLQEWLVGDQSFLVLLLTALLQHGLQLGLLQALSQGQKDVFQLGEHHGPVLGFVVQAEHLHEVLEAAGVLVLLDLGEDGHELVQGHHLDLLLLLAAELLDEGQGRVEVEGAQAVAEVVGIDLAVALEVVDGEGELDPFGVASTEFLGHSVGIRLAADETTHTPRCMDRRTKRTDGVSTLAVNFIRAEGALLLALPPAAISAVKRS